MLKICLMFFIVKCHLVFKKLKQIKEQINKYINKCS